MRYAARPLSAPVAGKVSAPAVAGLGDDPVDPAAGVDVGAATVVVVVMVVVVADAVVGVVAPVPSAGLVGLVEFGGVVGVVGVVGSVGVVPASTCTVAAPLVPPSLSVAVNEAVKEPAVA